MKSKMRIRKSLGFGLSSVAVAAASLLGAGVAQAQNDDELMLEEIIVTATKRAESIQDIPLSVTAIGQEELQLSGAVEFADYATAVPNLSFGFAGEGRQTSRQFQLRGISGANTTAFYINDTAVPITIDPRVIDISRIEVLRGPQGSLFGARSMGGLVRLVTNKPSTEEFSGSFHAGLAGVHEGGTDYQFDSTINVPLSDSAAFKVTGYYINDAGFIDRLVDPDASSIIASGVGLNGDESTNRNVNQDETFGFAGSLLLRLSDNVSITPGILYQKTNSEGPAFVDDDIENFTKARQFDVEETGRDEWYLASLETEIYLEHGQIVNSTSYFDRETLVSI